MKTELILLLDSITQKINDQGHIVDDRLLQRKRQIEAMLQEQRQLEKADSEADLFDWNNPASPHHY